MNTASSSRAGSTNSTGSLLDCFLLPAIAIVAASLFVAPAAAGSLPRRGRAPMTELAATWNPVLFMLDTEVFCTVVSAEANELWFCSADAKASE